MRTSIFRLVTLVTAIFASSSTWAEHATNMRRGVTAISNGIYDLHMTIFWICVAISIVVYGVMLYAIIFHRKSKGAVAANFHENTTVEIIWTVIPFFILLAMAFPATKMILKMDDTSASELSIKITGHQWKWEYEYLNHNVRFLSNIITPELQIQNKDIKNPNYLLEVDEPLVIPTGTKVRFLTTSADVIHSWWVPELGVKKDAIPGFINEIWTRVDIPGTYRGQCAELCGARHGFMPIVVIAKTPEEFALWLEQKKKGS